MEERDLVLWNGP